MLLRISLEAQKVPGKGRELSTIYDLAWKKIAEFFDDEVGLNEWTFPLDEPGVLEKARGIFERLFPDHGKPIYEVLCATDIEPEDLDRAGFSVFGMFGDDASGLDAQDTAEVGDWLQSEVRCAGCGNRYQDPSYKLTVRGRRLPANKRLFTFYGELSIFCRPQFVSSYERSGLTGIEFQQIPAERTEGIELYRLILAPHKWKGREGVCEICGMKTNVRNIEFFNLPEQYEFDFQTVLAFSRHYFVFSRKAVEFLQGESHTRFRHCEIPILPDYLVDRIYPEKRIFRNGEGPTRVLCFRCHV